jgi:hypothetical protein
MELFYLKKTKLIRLINHSCNTIDFFLHLQILIKSENCSWILDMIKENDLNLGISIIY